MVVSPSVGCVGCDSCIDALLVQAQTLVVTRYHLFNQIDGIRIRERWVKIGLAFAIRGLDPVAAIYEIPGKVL